MRLNQNIKYREADKVLRANGYKKYSCNGSHWKYRNEKHHNIIVPKDLNPALWGRLVRENNLTI